MKQQLLAQIHNPVLPNAIGGGNNPDYTQGGSALGSIISGLVGALFIAGFLLSFIYLIMGGYKWTTSSGDKTKLEAARDEITNAIIGIIVVGSAYALTTIVAQFFGLELNNLPIPSLSNTQ
jgi:hypothetical protein